LKIGSANILRDWAKDKVLKQGEERKSRFIFRKRNIKSTRAVSVGSRVRLNQARNWSFRKPLLCHEFNKPYKQNVFEMKLFKKLTFLKIIVHPD